MFLLSIFYFVNKLKFKITNDKKTKQTISRFEDRNSIMKVAFEKFTEYKIADLMTLYELQGQNEARKANIQWRLSFFLADN